MDPSHHRFKDPSLMSKEGPKRPQGRQIAEHPLHPYEQARLRQCMKNSARLQQLVSQDDTSADLIGDTNAKGFKEKTRKKANKQSSNRPLSGIKFQSRKRVYAEQQFDRPTRRSIRITQPDAIVTPCDIQAPPPSQPNDGTQAALQDDGPAQHIDNTHMTNGGDAIPRPNGHNNMDNEDGSTQHDDNNIVGDGADGIVGDTTDGADGPTQHEEVPWDRGVNMGHGLNRLTRARGAKLPIVITEGNKRPLVPVIAAKYATECNIAVRNHIPVLTHWKEYKNQPALIDRFLGTLRAKFDIDTSDPVVRKGCLDMMQSAVRQQLYKLKKEFFDPFPLHLVMKTSPVKVMNDKQWMDLVEAWKTPKKMEVCQTNKDNRGDVKFHQTTGSRSYPVVVENLGDEYKDEEPDAFDLFRICHYSKKKKGFTPNVQLAVTQMGKQLAAPTEGGESNCATQVVADVLDRNTKNNHFLQNVGIQIVKRRSSLQIAQAQLEAERRTTAELQSTVNNQREAMDDLSKQVQENREKQAELEAKIELLLAQNRQS